MFRENIHKRGTQVLSVSLCSVSNTDYSKKGEDKMTYNLGRSFSNILQWFRDGDQLVLVKHDFVNLQESNVLFFDYPSDEAKAIQLMFPEMTFPEIKLD